MMSELEAFEKGKAAPSKSSLDGIMSI